MYMAYIGTYGCLPDSAEGFNIKHDAIMYLMGILGDDESLSLKNIYNDLKDSGITDIGHHQYAEVVQISDNDYPE